MYFAEPEECCSHTHTRTHIFMLMPVWVLVEGGHNNKIPQTQHCRDERKQPKKRECVLSLFTHICYPTVKGWHAEFCDRVCVIFFSLCLEAVVAFWWPNTRHPVAYGKDPHKSGAHAHTHTDAMAI